MLPCALVDVLRAAAIESCLLFALAALLAALICRYDTFMLIFARRHAPTRCLRYLRYAYVSYYAAMRRAAVAAMPHTPFDAERATPRRARYCYAAIYAALLMRDIRRTRLRHDEIMENGQHTGEWQNAEGGHAALLLIRSAP